tara:strand:+ start:133 stop:783 length:651 start_codon:yes stop_codon:yes gene_type:complete
MSGGEETPDPITGSDAGAGADADAGGGGDGGGSGEPTTPGQVPGVGGGAIAWKNIEGTPTPEDCRLKAAKEGIPTFIHRNSTHSTLPNSCQLNVWSDKFAGNVDDTVHTQGCTYGGTPENGCTPWPSVIGHQVHDRVAVGGVGVMDVMDPNECIELAASTSELAGADIWGYRTKNHASAPNSCFYFTGTEAFAGDTNDTAHIVGCVNGKDIRNGCA